MIYVLYEKPNIFRLVPLLRHADVIDDDQATLLIFASSCGQFNAHLLSSNNPNCSNCIISVIINSACFGDLAERTKIVMAWSGDHCLSVSRGITTLRAFGRENANFSAFQILLKNKSRGRTYLQRYEKDLIGNATMTFHETSCVQKTKKTFCFVAKTI